MDFEKQQLELRQRLQRWKEEKRKREKTAVSNLKPFARTGRNARPGGRSNEPSSSSAGFSGKGSSGCIRVRHSAFAGLREKPSTRDAGSEVATNVDDHQIGSLNRKVSTEPIPLETVRTPDRMKTPLKGGRRRGLEILTPTPTKRRPSPGKPAAERFQEDRTHVDVGDPPVSRNLEMRIGDVGEDEDESANEGDSSGPEFDDERIGKPGLDSGKRKEYAERLQEELKKARAFKESMESELKSLKIELDILQDRFSSQQGILDVGRQGSALDYAAESEALKRKAQIRTERRIKSIENKVALTERKLRKRMRQRAHKIASLGACLATSYMRKKRVEYEGELARESELLKEETESQIASFRASIEVNRTRSEVILNQVHTQLEEARRQNRVLREERGYTRS
uniref:Uncharacterized protein n=1 Tax=Rhodosorus marinus TaxID=101924 RepID=A0A7S2ZBG4_9RHOD|mmetsp:Transcript_12979/g.51563  ORF Transcript_12979/g.51563 Transcript_12979/m.51563 type:complete len:398 (+) Transcript_12979:177-1370(+)|eukprot:CAMPEP_0113957938 /NCGR_PEP_ID=MMETSP0011_2-20120614/3060_1 /TAXON_ID=101924 /ORGANISM="Rhodosorus marinus" /LENGTH=397 /DNA_ID=CAMNT_0000968581 /DNA_START=44 /DNA_END=1237 /DNA_ORIENTATION=- /assembly_acc=CAM_ASM_000156